MTTHLHTLAGCLLCALVLAAPEAAAQNLVPNPIFSEIAHCPDGRGQVSAAPPWYSPNGGGVDLAHECAGSGPPTGIPTNNWGHQFPLRGEGYAGVRIWRGGGLYREYLAVELKEALIDGDTYFLSFFVSPGDSMRYVSDDISMYLTAQPIPSQTLYPYTPQLVNPQGEIINDFDNWKEISGEYRAQGGEKYLMIGNFNDEEHTTLQLRVNLETYHESAYYFVDNVVVENCKSRLPEQILFAEKNQLCTGEELLLQGYTHPDHQVLYEWSTGEKTPSILVKEAGTYSLKAQINGCTKEERIQITEKQGPQISLGPDTTLCPGEQLLLMLEDTSSQYFWGDGSRGNQYLIEQAGSYTVEAYRGSCVSRDTLEVRYLAEAPAQSLQDTLLCVGEQLKLNAAFPGATAYAWNDLSTDSLLSVRIPGRYRVAVTTPCFTFERSFEVVGIDCGCELFIPNVFTPNGDGIHDHFVPQLKTGVQQYELQVFDRWGKQVFHSRQPDIYWDGRDGQTALSEGVYYWSIRYECLELGVPTQKIRTGYLTLLR